MNLRYARSSPNLMLFLLVVFTSELHGCKLVEKTYDGCGDRRIWLGGTINTNTYKGQTNTYGISRSIREMDWYCGYGGRERVAWRGEANRLIVSFSGNSRRITWQFYKCDPPPGCQAEKPPQETKDNCVGGGHLWLASGIEKSIPKGSSDDSIEISRGMRELQWYCAYLSAERVAWGGNANRIRVNFDWNGRISWEFFTCNPPAECRYNHHSSSLNIKVKKLHLTSAPTDKVAFGWESLFGKPADEIVVNLESKNCYKKSRTREIKQGQTLYYNYPPVFLNSFRDEPIKFWLSEEDSGFEGKNDLSEVVTISAEKMMAIRRYLSHNPNGWFELDYSVTVNGQNLFQEHKLLGFLAENLCINVMDFVTGPWTGFGRKIVKNAISVKTIGRFQSKNLARLYKSIEGDYNAGTLTKKNFFKAVMTYQFREGLKKSVQPNMKEVIREWAMDQTKLDEELKKLMKEAVERGIYEAGGNEWLAIYQEVSQKLIEFGSWFEELTGKLEFCLIEVLPAATNALYDVYFTVRK